VDVVHAMQIFVRIVDVGSFTGAAESMGFTTAHVSRTISELEGHLKTRLLNRTTRKLALTEAGSRYLSRCKTIIEEIHAAETEASGAHLAPFGKLRMHAPTGIGHYHIVPLIAQYSRIYPDVVIELTLSHMTPNLLAEGYDLAISAQSSSPDSGFIQQSLGNTCSVLCAGPGYLAEKGTPLQLQDLLQHTCLRLFDLAFPNGWEMQGDALTELGLSQNTFMVNMADTLAQATRENMGIGLIPQYVVADGIRQGNLVRVLPEVTMNQRKLSVIYPSRQFLDAKVRTWIDFLRDNIGARLAKDEQSVKG
jgi:DNA-binding transcriptional LysR family regulator